MSELAVFGALVLAVVVIRALDPAAAQAAQSTMSLAHGGGNTLVLVTSGWCAARAVAAIQNRAVSSSRFWLAAAMALGAVFVAVKVFEYGHMAEAGFGLESGGFATLYFLTTGFHLAHVVFGIVVLGLVARWPSLDNLETGCSFWHMVDLVWLVLFPVFYLIG